MKSSIKTFLSILSVLFISVLFTGCQAIGDIFGAGVYVGVFMVVVIVVIIIIVIARIAKK